jgi:hypothetical protein
MTDPKVYYQRLAALRAHLTEQGWRNSAGDFYTREIRTQVLGWLWLGQERGKGLVDVAPVVGVGHQEVERVVAELEETEYHAHHPQTISAPIGYLMPEGVYRVWRFDGGGNDSLAADDVPIAVQRYGMPFIESHATLAGIIDWMTEHPHGGSESRLPVALLLSGRAAEAVEVVDKALARFASHDYPYAMQYTYRAFRARFNAMVGSSLQGERH